MVRPIAEPSNKYVICYPGIPLKIIVRLLKIGKRYTPVALEIKIEDEWYGCVEQLGRLKGPCLQLILPGHFR
jgi:hypothetical protein